MDYCALPRKHYINLLFQWKSFTEWAYLYFYYHTNTYVAINQIRDAVIFSAPIEWQGIRMVSDDKRTMQESGLLFYLKKQIIQRPSYLIFWNLTFKKRTSMDVEFL